MDPTKRSSSTTGRSHSRRERPDRASVRSSFCTAACDSKWIDWPEYLNYHCRRDPDWRGGSHMMCFQIILTVLRS